MSLSTVYRNVMLLKSLGEVLELEFPDGSNRYDGNKPYPHPVVRCGKRICLSRFYGFAIRKEQQRLPFSNTISAICLHVATDILTAI
ncbi:MAG: transcriptional repressor [Deltaproteobacteria bacterium]|nr:transcriptional repressor [Deltaproteobacteria bacterium]